MLIAKAALQNAIRADSKNWKAYAELGERYEVEGDYAGVGHTDFWTKGSTASFLNSGAIAQINIELIKALHKTNFQKDIEI